MGREIKFRAFDEVNKVMHNDFQFIKSGDSGNDWIIFISDKYPLTEHKTNPFCNPNPYFSQQLKIVQYTGLKDKNGVDIYEGDILKFKFMEEFNHTINLKGMLYFDDTELRYKIEIFNDITYTVLNYFYNGRTFDMEVIGNIHQNPELLTV